MKAQYLKIAGVKNEKDFYKLFPTQESFMAKHGDKIKKAQSGLQFDGNNNGIPDYLESNSQPNQLFPAGKMPQLMGPQMGVYQNANQTFADFNQRMVANSNSGLMQSIKGLFAGGDSGNGGINKAIGDIGGSLGIGNKAGASSTPLGNASGYLSGIMDIGKGIASIGKQKKMKRQARSDRDVVEITRQAFDSKDVNTRQDLVDSSKRTRKALMPSVDADALFPTYGVGTNVLAKNGKKIKTAQNGEIMNTYAPGTLYDDLGYESTFKPLNNEEQIKSYMNGGMFSAQNGINFNPINLTNTLGQLSRNNNMLSLSDNYAPSNNLSSQESAGGQIGGGIGGIAGTFFGGPLGGMIGKFAGEKIGGAIDPNRRKIKGFNNEKAEDINYMMGSAGIQNARANIAGAYTKNGGIMRTGGSLRSNSVGEIEAVSGGYLEPISYNPYTGGTGITSMIEGQSHDESNGEHSGVILNYNDNNVEAERGEPISERQDGGSIGESAVIAGDQTFNKLGSKLLPHLSKYEGKKIKNIQKEIAEKDAKLNKFESKNNIFLKEFQPKTSIDKLTMNSYIKNDEGIQQKYAINANEVDDLIAYQQATNDTAKIMGVNAGDLSRGKIKYESQDRVAQFGKNMPSRPRFLDIVEPFIDPPKGAQGNIDPNKKYAYTAQTPGALDYTPIGKENLPMFASEEAYAKYKKETEAAYNNPEIAKQLVQYFNEYDGEDWQDVRAAMNKGKTFEEQRQIAKRLATDGKPGRFHINLSEVITPDNTISKPITSVEKDNFDVSPYQGNSVETFAGQILPWLRNMPGENLTLDLIAGELGSLGEDIDPVQARYYHPNLRTPYDISYQDQLNENQADFNQLTKLSSYNPEALGALAAQKYAANSRVLAEQFRANQANKENIYSQNTATLNDALLKNLSIADQQYVRQTQAKANTKEIRKAAMDSIASKTLQNRLENRMLQVGSNEFKDFSFDSSGRLIKTGAPTSFEIPQNYNPKGKLTQVPIYDDNKEIIGYQKIDTKIARNGNIVKAFKNL